MPESQASQPDLELPRIIGRYEVLRLVGEGAMGRVLCAHDPVLGRDVAVKLLRGDLLIPRDVREGLLARMRHEARAAARVTHPNLVTLHDMGEDGRFGLYLVFEYVEGPTLKQRLKAGAMPAGEAARLARELGSALTFAHGEGILHRDIKPENIILSRTGGKIADFGIAKIPDSTLTHAGGLMGTPAYSAPETFGGKNFSPASDQFSLAASLYEAICGERAFPGDDAVEVAARISRDPPNRFAARRGLPPAVDDVFAVAMAKAPHDRYESCAAFGEALAEALAPAVETPAPRATAPSAPGRVTAASIHHEATPEVAVGLPSERKRGQVLLGMAVVAVTAALLVRLALHDDGEAVDGRALPSASASADAPPPASADKPRPTVSTPQPRTSRPRVEPSSSASEDPPEADAGPALEADAGLDASAPEPSGSAAPSAPPTSAPSASATSAPSALPASPAPAASQAAPAPAKP
ncbi:serine/threonine-protein kinase [Polyangium sp. 15x6]|uniref:serine/threonine-protein kinase n=1 Tax=Polyangium sp. 15x6 TaxID=3042687 RepID=UPI00249B5725|nr:serine/threonine-protein kinase [Polyangium sp. 15x6]MDI3291242.1 protein kinase [Polyangium sp. 15x6]